MTRSGTGLVVSASIALLTLVPAAEATTDEIVETMGAGWVNWTVGTAGSS